MRSSVQNIIIATLISIRLLMFSNGRGIGMSFSKQSFSESYSDDNEVRLHLRSPPVSKRRNLFFSPTDLFFLFLSTSTLCAPMRLTTNIRGLSWSDGYFWPATLLIRLFPSTDM